MHATCQHECPARGHTLYWIARGTRQHTQTDGCRGKHAQGGAPARAVEQAHVLNRVKGKALPKEAPARDAKLAVAAGGRPSSSSPDSEACSGSAVSWMR